MHDSYSAIIHCKFPALLACICGARSDRHIKMGFSFLHSLYLCPATHNPPLLPPTEKIYTKYSLYIKIYIKYSYINFLGDNQKFC